MTGSWYVPLLEPQVLALCLFLSLLLALATVVVVGFALGAFFAVVWVARAVTRLVLRFRGVVGGGYAVARS